jgi:vacuolar-type H+-ATPase subunit E/Vma4
MMLSLIRRVPFPQGLQTSGPVIKGSMLKHIQTYHDILRQARLDANVILAKASNEAELIKEESQQKAADEVRTDLHALKEMTAQKESTLLKASSSICTEVCTIVLEQFIESVPDTVKIKTLIDALVARSHSARELNLRANPTQLVLVEETLAQVLAEQLNLRKWKVTPDDSLEKFQLRISTTNGSEINVSLSNLIAMYKEEIEKLAPTLEPSLQNLEVRNESIY